MKETLVKTEVISQEIHTYRREMECDHCGSGLLEYTNKHKNLPIEPWMIGATGCTPMEYEHKCTLCDNVKWLYNRKYPYEYTDEEYE
jgi:hypothetical protein